MRLLLIEDDYPAAQALMSALVRIDGSYRISNVATLASALRELRSPAVFDLMLVSLDLADAHAWHILVWLFQSFPQVPKVVRTAELGSRLVTQALKSGARDFLHKGVQRPHAIDRALRCALERQRRGEDGYVLIHTLLVAEQGKAADRAALIPGEATIEGIKGASDPRLLRIMTHELLDELNVVTLEADVIQLAVGCGESVQVDQSIARIHEKCGALAHIIRQLRFSRN